MARIMGIEKPAKIFAADLWPVFNFADPNVRYDGYLSRGRPALKGLIDSVLLHDEIVVPTQDFMAATVLVGVLGEDAVRTLLEAGCLRFLRVRGALAYVGNGGGIKSYEMTTAAGAAAPFMAPVEEAVSWALAGLKEQPQDVNTLRRQILEVTSEKSVAPLAEEVRHETYMGGLVKKCVNEFRRRPSPRPWPGSASHALR